MNNIIVERRFVVPIWDEIVKQKVIIYWSRKRFKFTQVSDDTLLAKRGRWIGNLISADLTYVKAQLSIKVTSNLISCVMEINPRFQIISEWDMTWWNLEMQTFESYVLRGDEQLHKWKQFKNEHKAAFLNWSLAGGRDPALLEMSAEERERYQ